MGVRALNKVNKVMMGAGVASEGAVRDSHPEEVTWI